jgi:hypothetical protein
MLLKITLRNHLKALSFHLLGTLMMLVVLLWLHFDKDITLIFAVFWLVYTIPTLYLHIEYYLQNKHDMFIIANQEITVEKHGKQTTYLARDIKEIVVYMAPNIIKGNYFRFLPIESYYYGHVKTITGQDLIITSLLTPNVRDVLKQVNVGRYFEEGRLFCTLSIKD